MIEPLPLFCSMFGCEIISYRCYANSSLYIGIEEFFGTTLHTLIMSGLCVCVCVCVCVCGGGGGEMSLALFISSFILSFSSLVMS